MKVTSSVRASTSADTGLPLTFMDTLIDIAAPPPRGYAF
jgi:hypothetical protein